MGEAPGDPWHAQQSNRYFENRILRPGEKKNSKKINFDLQKKVSSGNEGVGLILLFKL